MGVAGLWEILEGTSQSIPISKLSLDAFNSPTSPRTYALRIGIDASLWIFHANRQSSQAGLNPFVRTLFFKTLKLLQHPILPLFVFDGPYKPAMKRGQKVAGKFGTDDQGSKRFKKLLDDMGIEYWTAPGEAEAELAELSKLGKIDAVLTDDVDALVFGATKILRNTSRTLSSNNRLVYENVEDFQVYTLDSITRPAVRSRTARRARSQSEDMNSDSDDDRLYSTRKGKGKGKDEWNGLSVEGMIFIALCSGGDYHTAGIPSCGPKIAHGLAQTPLATELINAYRTMSPARFQDYLVEFRAELKRELSTNSLGFLPNKRKQLAQTLPETFPQVEIIDYYVNPRVSEGSEVWQGFGKREEGTAGAGKRGGRGDPRSFAIVCEKYFEWGTKEEVGKRMKTLVWRGEVINQLREKLLRTSPATSGTSAAVGGKTKNSRMTSYFQNISSSQASARSSQEKGKGKRRALERTSSTSSLEDFVDEFPRADLVTIHSSRQHASTGMILEYRIEYDHKLWTRTVQAVMEGTRIDPDMLPEQERAALGLTTRADEERAGSVTSGTGDDESTGSQASDHRMDCTPKAKGKKDLDSNDRLWIPAELVKAGWPKLVEAYETKLREKAEKAALRTPRRTKKTVDLLRSATKGKTPSPREVRMRGWTSDEEEPGTSSPVRSTALQGWLNSGATLKNTSSPAPSPSSSMAAGRTRAVRTGTVLPSNPISIRSSSPPVPIRRSSRPASSSASSAAGSTSGEEWGGTPRRLFDTPDPKPTKRRSASRRARPVASQTAVAKDMHATPIARPTRRPRVVSPPLPVEVIEILSSSEDEEEEEIEERPRRPDMPSLRPSEATDDKNEPEGQEEEEEEEEEEQIEERPRSLSSFHVTPAASPTWSPLIESPDKTPTATTNLRAVRHPSTTPTKASTARPTAANVRQKGTIADLFKPVERPTPSLEVGRTNQMNRSYSFNDDFTNRTGMELNTGMSTTKTSTTTTVSTRYLHSRKQAYILDKVVEGIEYYALRDVGT